MDDDEDVMGGESELMEDGEQVLEYEDSDSDIDGEDNWLIKFEVFNLCCHLCHLYLCRLCSLLHSRNCHNWHQMY